MHRYLCAVRRRCDTFLRDLAQEGDALGLHGGGLIERLRANRSSIGWRWKRRQNFGDGDLNGGVVLARVGEEVAER